MGRHGVCTGYAASGRSQRSSAPFRVSCSNLQAAMATLSMHNISAPATRFLSARRARYSGTSRL